MAIDLTINKNEIDSCFKRIANDIMNHWVFKIETKTYRITEIEFYLKSEFHNDKYTHGHKLQLETEKWYFHGSGIDLTFGANGFYGGILIRALYDFKGDSYIYGPLNCVTELFSNIKHVYESNLSFGLIRATQSEFEFEKPIPAPRVGLNPEKDKEQFCYFHRFLIMPKHKHAEKTKIAEGMRKQGYSDIEIKNIWG